MKTIPWTRAAVAVAAVAFLTAAALGVPRVRAFGTEAARITLADLKKDLDAGRVLVVDVRGDQAYATGHIPGAVSIPLEALPQHLAELKSEKRPIVTYCS